MLSKQQNSGIMDITFACLSLGWTFGRIHLFFYMLDLARQKIWSEKQRIHNRKQYDYIFINHAALSP